jgi:hypothetical protein
VPEGRPDRPDRPGPADLGRDPAVRSDLAAGDLEGLHPDGPLELGRAAQVEVDPVAAVAGEAALDLPGQALRQRVAASRDPAGPGVEARLKRLAVGCLLDRRDTRAFRRPERPDGRAMTA